MEDDGGGGGGDDGGWLGEFDDDASWALAPGAYPALPDALKPGKKNKAAQRAARGLLEDEALLRPVQLAALSGAGARLCLLVSPPRARDRMSRNARCVR
jgi:hypothetical protein